MKKLLFLLLIYVYPCFAINPAIRGKIICNDKIIRDGIYNSILIQNVSSKGIFKLTKQDFDISVGTTPAHYTIELYIDYGESDIQIRNDLKNNIKILKGNPSIIDYHIEIWDSNNDGISGQCKPDFSVIIIKKGD